MGMILRIASSRIVGQGDIVGRSGYFSLNLSANSVMRGRLDARRTLKSLVADLRLFKTVLLIFGLATRSSLISTPSNSDIRDRVCKSGCVVFVHHFEIVTGSFPSCSASHLFVWPASASTALSRFRFAIFNLLTLNANIIVLYVIEIMFKYVFFENFCLYGLFNV